jgi:hypothetical protein
MVVIHRSVAPTITCIDATKKIDMKVDFDKMITALQTYVDGCLATVWRTPAKLAKASKPQADTWTLIFYDDATALRFVGFEAYHELTHKDLPIARVFVKTTLDNNDEVSVAASHELAEMLIDPASAIWAVGPDGAEFAYEICDAVENETFEIDGISMSDFVFPTYFDLFRKPKSIQFDYLEKVDRPFQILRGGYSLLRDGSKLINKFGSITKERKFEKEDRTGHRSEFRRAMLRQKPRNTAKLRAHPK